MESLNRALELLDAERAVLFWGIPLLFALMAFYLLAPTVKAWRRRRRLDRLVGRLGPESMSGVVLEDGMDGLVHIDRIVVGPQGLSVVTLVPDDGIVFGGEEIDRWTRVVGRRTIKFPNPLAATREGMVAVEYHLPGAPVRGLALFTGECSFPKGKPEAALLAGELPVPAGQQEIPEGVRTYWDRLKELAARTAERHSSQLRLMQPERALGRPLLGWTMLAAAGSLAGWRLVLGL